MMPNWTIPKSSTSRIGRTKANSVIVCPLSFLILVVVGCTWVSISGKCGAIAAAGRAPLMPGRLNEQPHHACDYVRSAVREPCEGENRGSADHGESERVLRHRLSTLTREKRDQLLDSMPSVVLHDYSLLSVASALSVVRLTGTRERCRSPWRWHLRAGRAPRPRQARSLPGRRRTQPSSDPPRPGTGRGGNGSDP